MGQIFQKHATQYDPSIVITLKNTTMKDIFECVDSIDKYYPQSCYLNYDQFYDIFAPLTGDCMALFDRLKDNFDESDHPKVHTFEALAAFAMFSGESYEMKCMFIFRLFDFDLSNTLEEPEMINTLQCVVRSMCKIAGLVVPSITLLQQLAEVCFMMMDEDKDKHVDFDEFYIWTVNNDELQEFMLEYSGTQTYEYAQKRMQLLMDDSERIFHKWAKECQSATTLLPALVLEQNLPLYYTDVDPLCVNALFYMMVEYSLRMKGMGADEHSTSQKNLWAWELDPKKSRYLLEDLIIKKSDYLDIIRAWNAYSVADINNLSTVSIKELKLLLWLFEEEEPDHFKLNQEMSIIDGNQNKTIERIEWIKYLCSEESMLNRNSPITLLKKIFDNFDMHQTGYIALVNIDSLLRDSFKQQMKKLKDIKSIQVISNTLTSMKQELVKQLKRTNQDKLDWSTYYKFLLESSLSYNIVSKLLNLHSN